MKPPRTDRPYGEKLQGFFYESWLMKELTVKNYKPFVPQITFEQGIDKYWIWIRDGRICSTNCSIKVGFPYLYVRIQQTEEREKLFGFIHQQPLLHLFVRHFPIPSNVDTDRISYRFTEQGLRIYLPKYYPD
jgi:HSP20 family molecular chaperone IbpA